MPGHQPLLVRNTMGHASGNIHGGKMKTETQYSFPFHRPPTSSTSRLSQSSFYSRHNPHPFRVRHIKGLLDVPICSVHDDGYVSNPRYNMMTPSTPERKRLYHQYRMPLSQLSVGYPAVSARDWQKRGFLPSVALKSSWRDELRELTEQAGLLHGLDRKPAKPEIPHHKSMYSEETGRLIPPPQRGLSRASTRGNNRGIDLSGLISDEDQETLVLEMLCQILNTDSLSAVQAWLVSAPPREKELVLDMIKSALVSEADYAKNVPAEVDRAVTAQSMDAPPSRQMNGYHTDNNDQITTSRYTKYKWTPTSSSSRQGGHASKRQMLSLADDAIPEHEPVNHQQQRPLSPGGRNKSPTRTVSRQSHSSLSVAAEPRLRYTTTSPARQSITSQKQSLHDILKGAESPSRGGNTAE